MVSQGQRQFEGIPNEDSGAEKISSYNGGNNQVLFEHTRKQNNSPDRQFTDSTNSLENSKLYSNKDNLTAPEVQGILVNENDSPVQNCSPSLFLGSKVNKARGSHPINDEYNLIMVDMEEEELSSFKPSKDHDGFSEGKTITQPQVHLKNTSKDTCNSTIPNQNDCSSDDCLTKDNGGDGIETSETTTCTPTHDVIQDENCENVYMTSQSSTSENPQLNHNEISCGSQSAPASSRSSVYTGVHSADSIVSDSLQRSAKAQHLTLDSESQLLLSGVQTIPEQLPLILTEGDSDEEQASLNVMAGTEQLQAVSTQAVLGSNLGSGSSALMVLASTEINPSGHLIPIGGTNLLVLHGIDGQGQLIPPNSVIVTGQSPLLPKSAEQVHGPEPVKPIGKQYRCPQDGCTKIAPTSSKLKLHMLSHTGERPHKCPLDGCEWAFTTAYKLKRHIRGHTGERPFICEINGCGKCFTTTYNLKTHQKAHIREQVNVCSFENCEQSFSTLHKLKVHEKKHQLENELHTCNEEGCGKQFKSLSNYNAHCKTHNGERPHACTFEGCGKRFTKASKLKLHVRTHTGERPFICEDEGCDWSFTSAYKLKRHMRKHTGERPFTCQFTGCGKSFTRASHMRTHALSHTGQKPFICPVPDCLKGFTAASSLNIHIRKHSGDKPFKCVVEGCGKAYTTGANLRLHQKRHEDKTLNEHEVMEKEDHVASDHPRPVHYVEICGVNSVLESDPNSVPTTPYSVMHAFTGEDFGTEDVASLTVVQFSSEETFPPETPVSTMDSSSGICFQFSSSDTYANPPHSSTSSSFSGLSFTAGTPLPSPGAHYTQTNIAEVDVEASEDLETTSNERQYLEKCSHDSCPENTTGVSDREYIVREQPVGTERALNGGGKDDEDLTLPTMVVFAPSGVQPPHSPPTRSENDVETNEADGRQNSESTIRHLTIQQPCETSSIAQFAPPAIIFQGEEAKTHDEEVKTHEGDAKINYSPVNVDTVKETERSDSNMTNHSRQQTRSTSLSGLPVSSLSLNLSSLADDIDKSPGSPFITDVDHALDHESTINLQDLR